MSEMIMIGISAAHWYHMWSQISRKGCELQVFQIKVLWKRSRSGGMKKMIVLKEDLIWWKV